MKFCAGRKLVNGGKNETPRFEPLALHSLIYWLHRVGNCDTAKAAAKNHPGLLAEKTAVPVWSHAAYTSYASQRMPVHSASRAAKAICGFEGLHFAAALLGNSDTRSRIASQPRQAISLAAANGMRVLSSDELRSPCFSVSRATDGRLLA
jgi:hypothetical protein